MQFCKFLPYSAESYLRAKSVNRTPFKGTECQNVNNMWFPIENLRKNAICFLEFPLFCIRNGQKPIFIIKHCFCSENMFYLLPNARMGNFNSICKNFANFWPFTTTYKTTKFQLSVLIFMSKNYWFLQIFFQKATI